MHSILVKVVVSTESAVKSYLNGQACFQTATVHLHSNQTPSPRAGGSHLPPAPRAGPLSRWKIGCLPLLRSDSRLPRHFNPKARRITFHFHNTPLFFHQLLFYSFQPLCLTPLHLILRAGCREDTRLSPSTMMSLPKVTMLATLLKGNSQAQSCTLDLC